MGEATGNAEAPQDAQASGNRPLLPGRRHRSLGVSSERDAGSPRTSCGRVQESIREAPHAQTLPGAEGPKISQKLDIACSIPCCQVLNTADYPNVPVTEEDTKAAVLATLSFLLEWHASWTAGARSMQASLAYGTMGQILGASALLHQVSFWAENTPNEGQLPAEAFESWRKDPSKIYLLTKYLRVTTAHLNHQHLKRQSAGGDSRQAFDSAESQTELN